MQCTKLKTYMETGRVVFLPPSRIRPNPAQPRTVFSPEGLEELAASIAVHGILQPLSVRRMESHYELIAGERRYRAAQMAGLREIPCIVMRMDEQESSFAALLENLQRQDLNFVEEARAFSQMMTRFSMSQEQVAKAVGKSQSAVANTLRILRHSPPVLEKLLEHNLTQRHARALLKLPTEPAKLTAIAHITRNHLSVTQTEQYIDSLLKPSPAPQASLVQREVAGIFDSGRRDCNELTQAIPQSFCCAKIQPPLHKGALDASQEILSQILQIVQNSNLPISVQKEDSPTHTILTLHIPK